MTVMEESHISCRGRNRGKRCITGANQVNHWEARTIAGLPNWSWNHGSVVAGGGGSTKAEKEGEKYPGFSLSPALQTLTHTEVRKHNLLISVYL